MDRNENTTDYDGGNGESPSILIGIIGAIILGVIIGGFAPGFAKHFSVLGEIFLNSLKMIVVPLVVLSMIVGITGLGDIRNIGTIGGRTILYYMVTTAVSVIIGIIMVNIVRPGVGISTGEGHQGYLYTLDDRTVNIGDESWDKKSFKNYEQKGDKKYLLVLPDQNIQGIIESVTQNSVTVKAWKYVEADDVFYVQAGDTEKALRTVNGQVISADPDFELIERFPCLATIAPALAAIIAALVEILRVPLISPPVPQVSIVFLGEDIFIDLSLITLAAP